MSNLFKKVAFASILALGARAAHAQVTIYTTDFGAAGTAASDGYTYELVKPPEELTFNQTTAGGSGQNGWLTNDPDLASGATASDGNFIGGSNYVGTNGTFFTGYSANVGQQSGVDPGAATTYVYKPVSLTGATTTYSFNTDFVVTGSTNGTQDSFGFTLLNSAGTKLLSVNTGTVVSNVTVGGVADTAVDIGYEIGNATTLTTTTKNGIILNGVYHLTITVNVQTDTFSAFYTGSGVTAGIATNLSLSGQITPTTVSELAATWTLTNQTKTGSAYETLGNDNLLFDNYTVTIPEPSTCAMVGAGFLGLGGLLKFRRRHA